MVTTGRDDARDADVPEPAIGGALAKHTKTQCTPGSVTTGFRHHRSAVAVPDEKGFRRLAIVDHLATPFDLLCA